MSTRDSRIIVRRRRKGQRLNNLKSVYKNLCESELDLSKHVIRACYTAASRLRLRKKKKNVD